MDFSTEAIVLRNIKLNETDKIVHLYSPEYGLISAIAKGAFKLDSKLAAKTQVINHSDFLLAKGRNLDIIKEAKIIEQYKNVKKDFDLTNYAYFFLDLVHQTATVDEDHRACFDLLDKSLKKLNTFMLVDDEEQNILSLCCDFQWQLIDLLGYKPDLEHCSLTHRARNQNQIPKFFDLVNGGITSTQAYREFMEAYPDQNQIKAMTKDVFNIFDQLDKRLERTEFKVDSLNSSIKMLQRHLEHKIAKEFKSKKLLPVFN